MSDPDRHRFNDCRQIPPFVWITDNALEPTRILQIAAQAAAAGCRLIQLRRKSSSTRETVELGKALLEVVRPHSCRLIVNDRIDVAVAVGAAGVHLPSAGIRSSEARAILGEHALIGRSVHSSEEITAEAPNAADYVQFGPVYATASKAEFGPPQGLSRLKRAVEAAQRNQLALIAVGGINEDNVGDVRSTGAAGIAAIGALTTAVDVASVVARLTPTPQTP